MFSEYIVIIFYGFEYSFVMLCVVDILLLILEGLSGFV